MRTNFRLLLCVVFALVSLSAMAQKSKTTYYYNESSARNIELGQRVLTTPMIADLKVVSDKKIEPYVEVFPFVMSPQIKDAVPGFKRSAFANAAKKNNADALVGTDIIVTTNEEGFVVVTVTGYPAQYTNFRNATREDLWMLEFYRQTFGNERSKNPALFTLKLNVKNNFTMKRILILLALLAVPVLSSAQLVQSSSMVKVKTKTHTENIRHGWSIAASIAGGDVIKGYHKGFDIGLYADGGYHFNSWFYLGATLGANYRNIPDSVNGTKDDSEDKVRPQFMLNPRFKHSYVASVTICRSSGSMLRRNISTERFVPDIFISFKFVI